MMFRRIEPGNRRSTQTAVLLGLCLIAFSGCTSMPSMLTSPLAWKNPFASAPPAYKSQYGLTPRQKVDRLRALAQQAGGMDLAQQSSLSHELMQTFQKENDPLMRSELVRTLGNMATPEANEGLRWAINDDHERVRIAACEAWGRRNDPEAAGVLSAVLAEDNDVDVRLAASQALARRPGGESLAHLAATLEDRDPAVQLATMQSLREATGANLGNDVNDWLAYLNTQSEAYGIPGSSAPTNVPSPNIPLPSGTEGTARLVSGERSVPQVRPPVYKDVSSGSVFQ